MIRTGRPIVAPEPTDWVIPVAELRAWSVPLPVAAWDSVSVVPLAVAVVPPAILPEVVRSVTGKAAAEAGRESKRQRGRGRPVQRHVRDHQVRAEVGQLTPVGDLRGVGGAPQPVGRRGGGTHRCRCWRRWRTPCRCTVRRPWSPGSQPRATVTNDATVDAGVRTARGRGPERVRVDLEVNGGDAVLGVAGPYLGAAGRQRADRLGGPGEVHRQRRVQTDEPHSWVWPAPEPTSSTPSVTSVRFQLSAVSVVETLALARQ